MTVSSWPGARSYFTAQLGLDSFDAWTHPPWVGLFYFLYQIIGSITMAFVYAWGAYKITNIYALAVIVGAAEFLYASLLLKWTGAAYDSVSVFGIGACEAAYGRKKLQFVSGPGASLERASVFGKVVVFIPTIFLATIIGVALTSTVTGLPVTTDDCTTDPSVSCSIRPVVTGVGTSEGRWINVLASLAKMASYFIAWIMIAETGKNKYRKMLKSAANDGKDIMWDEHTGYNWWQAGLCIGLMQTIITALTFDNVGFGYVFDFTLATSFFSKNYDSLVDLAWGPFIALVCIFVSVTIHCIAADRTTKYKNEHYKSTSDGDIQMQKQGFGGYSTV